MRRPSSARRAGANLVCTVLVAALASGCSTLRRVPPGPGGSSGSVRPGDAVRIVKHDGTVLDAYVATVAEDGLVVEPDRRDGSRGATAGVDLVAIRYTEIERMDRYRFAPAKTAVAVGVVVAAVAYLAFIGAMRDAWSRGWGSTAPASAVAGPRGR